MNREELFQSLGRLRKGFLLNVFVLTFFGLILFPFSKTLLRHLHSFVQHDLVAFGIPEAFLSSIKVTLFASLFLSIPFIFYQLRKAFLPVFRPRGVNAGGPIFLAALFLFYLGAFFCYFVTLPFGIRFLLGYQSAHLQPMISVNQYVSFCAVFIFAFGLAFELPLVLALLSSLGLVHARWLTRNRRYAILLIAVLAAVVTPTPDAFNMALMGGPLYVLFEAGILLVKMMERRRAAAVPPAAKGPDPT